MLNDKCVFKCQVNLKKLFKGLHPCIYKDEDLNWFKVSKFSEGLISIFTKG